MLKKTDVFGKEMLKCTHCGREFAIARPQRGLKAEPQSIHECPLDRHPKMSELMKSLSRKS